MRRFFYAIIFAVLLNSCKTTTDYQRVTPDVWGDATLVAEQRAEIEQLRRDFTVLGKSIGKISDRINSITDELTDGLGQCNTIEDIFGEIDKFIRILIDENRQLRELQPADRTENAGAR